MKVVTVHLPEAYLEAIDELVKKRLYPNRAEVIRVAVRDLIRRESRLLAELSGFQLPLSGSQKSSYRTSLVARR